VHKARGVDDDINAGKIRECEDSSSASKTNVLAEPPAARIRLATCSSLAVAGGEVDMCPFTRQSVRSCAADSAAAAKDDGGFVFEPIVHTLTRITLKSMGRNG
jgi:hypothetical protein